MSTLLQDDFNGPDATAIADHSPQVGGPWTTVAAGWSISGNKLVSDPAAEATAPMGRTTGSAQLNFDAGTFGAGDLLTFILKVSANDYIEVAIGPASVDLTIAFDGAFPYVATIDGISIEVTGNRLQVIVGPATVEFRFNGRLLGKFPRAIDPQEKFITARIKWASAGATSPALTGILVTGIGSFS